MIILCRRESAAKQDPFNPAVKPIIVSKIKNNTAGLLSVWRHSTGLTGIRDITHEHRIFTYHRSSLKFTTFTPILQRDDTASNYVIPPYNTSQKSSPKSSQYFSHETSQNFIWKHHSYPYTNRYRIKHKTYMLTDTKHYTLINAKRRKSQSRC